jgi:hypothetical protein
MRIRNWIAATLLSLALVSCTQNIRAKAYGGTAEVDLPAGTKLVTATWKDAQLWYLVRPAKPGEAPETLTLHEQSSFGVIQGKVVFREK